MRFGSSGILPVAQRDIGSKQRKVVALLALGLNGVFATLGRGATARIRRLIRLRSRGRAAEQLGLLSEGILRDELLPLQLLDSALQLRDLGFVHLKRCGSLCDRRIRFRRGLRLLWAGEPHDDNHQKRETENQPRLDVLRQKAGRLRVPFPEWVRSLLLSLGGLLLCVLTTRERELLLADGEVSAIENLRNDVNAVLELEVDEVRFAVFHFVKSRLLSRGALDVGEGVVVVNRRNQERLSRGFLVDLVVEPELRGILVTEFIDLLFGLGLRLPEPGRSLARGSSEFPSGMPRLRSRGRSFGRNPVRRRSIGLLAR